jgi:hypothetical protein
VLAVLDFYWEPSVLNNQIGVVLVFILVCKNMKPRIRFQVQFFTKKREKKTKKHLNSKFGSTSKPGFGPVLAELDQKLVINYQCTFGLVLSSTLFLFFSKKLSSVFFGDKISLFLTKKLRIFLEFFFSSIEFYFFLFISWNFPIFRYQKNFKKKKKTQILNPSLVLKNLGFQYLLVNKLLLWILKVKCFFFGGRWSIFSSWSSIFISVWVMSWLLCSLVTCVLVLLFALYFLWMSSHPYLFFIIHTWFFFFFTLK